MNHYDDVFTSSPRHMAYRAFLYLCVGFFPIVYRLILNGAPTGITNPCLIISQRCVLRKYIGRRAFSALIVITFYT